MKDWQDKLDGFLKFNEHAVLLNAGNIFKKQADEYARREYEKFEIKRREYIERQAEGEYINELEQAAREFPEKGTGGEKHGQA